MVIVQKLNQDEIDKIKKAQEGLRLLKAEEDKLVEVLTEIEPFISKESLESCEKLVSEFVRIIYKERGRLIDEQKPLNDEGIPR